MVEEEPAMKRFEFPIATVDLARLVPTSIQNLLRVLLCFLTLSATSLLNAAPTPAKSFHLPLTFEQNRGQAPGEVKWMGQKIGRAHV